MRVLHRLVMARAVAWVSMSKAAHAIGDWCEQRALACEAALLRMRGKF